MSQAIIRLLRDGTGRVCIHYFVHDPPPKSLPEITMNPVLVAPTGYIACRKARGQEGAQAQMVGMDYELVPHSNEARAVTCPACMATQEYRRAMELIADLEQSAANPTMDPRTMPKQVPVQVVEKT